MKIAIVGPGFTGASFPLAHHLQQVGHEVDCYYLTRIGLKSIESLDLTVPLKSRPKEVKIPVENRLYQYLDKEVGVFIIPLYQRHKKLEKLIVGNYFKWANYFRTQRFIKNLLKRNYERVILIDQFDDGLIGKALLRAGIKFVTSYHEVLDNLIDSQPVVRKKVINSLNLNRPVIIHSRALQNQLINYSGVSNIKQRLNYIPFGPFESLWQYGEGTKVKDTGKDYFLFLGRITPYKGLDILYDAIEILSSNHSVKVVIAGNGINETLKKMMNDSRYVVINRFINNGEMVWLVKNSRAIVCPYTAASQSGLTSLAYAFNKPVIATKVGAFPEIIEDGINGYLTDSVTGVGFSRALLRFIEGEDKLKDVRIPDAMNWNVITRQVVDLLSKI